MKQKPSDNKTSKLSSNSALHIRPIHAKMAPRRQMKKKLQKQPTGLNKYIPGQTTRLVYLCVYAAMGIAILSLIGWMTGVRILAGQWGNFTPMSPLSALSFLLFSSALFCHARWPLQRISRFFVLATLSIVSFFALIVLGQFIMGIDLGIEKALLYTNELLSQTPIGRMSPISAISFLLESMTFFILLIAPLRSKSLVIAALFIIIAIGINFIILIGYAYGAPLLFGGADIPVALFTAITFVCIGVGQIFLILPGLPGLQRWNRTTFRGMLLRAFLPFILVFTLLEGWVDATFGDKMINPVVFHSLAALVAGVLVLVIIGWISERMGAAFEQSQAQISSLTRFPDENPNPVLRVASDGRLLYANSSSQHLLNSWKCKQPGDVLPKGQRRLVEASIRSNTNHREEITCGKIIYELVYSPAQGLDYLNIYGNDITERNKEEQQIRYQASLLDEVSDAIVASDENHKITSWNKSAELLFGWKEEEVLGRTTSEILQTVYLGISREKMLTIIRETGSWRGETTRIRKDGMRVQLEISSIALYDSKGKVTGFVSVNRDISTDKALQNSEAELEALFASMKDLVIIYDKEGRYLKIASKDTSMLIKHTEDLLGKTIHEVFPKEEADRFVHHIQTVLETQRTISIEYSLEIDQRKVWFDASVSPLNSDTVIWVARDISDRKLMEEESRFIGIHDSLTQLYNRTFFEEELSRLEKSRLFPVSIFMIDVDKLKIINDTQGHAAGDTLIQRTAQVLQKCFRPEDMVARIGGDEFVVLLPLTNEDAAYSALNRINYFLELNNKNDHHNDLKISIGSATCNKQDSLAETLKKADDLMYQNKRAKG